MCLIYNGYNNNTGAIFAKPFFQGRTYVFFYWHDFLHAVEPNGLRISLTYIIRISARIIRVVQ